MDQDQRPNPTSLRPGGNLWALPGPRTAVEWFDPILETGDLRVERIVSTGQVTAPGQWYDQEQDEWVALLQGQAILEYDDGSRQTLVAGDHVFLPAHCRHRVAFTSQQPPCIWLAIHGRLSGETGSGARTASL